MTLPGTEVCHPSHANPFDWLLAPGCISVTFARWQRWHLCYDKQVTARSAGTFKLTLEFSEEYPNKAPVVKFKSTMFHPNSKY